MTKALDAQMPCRLEKVDTPALNEAGVNVWLDVCHNEQGLQHVLSEFSTDPIKSSKPLVVVSGYSKAKNISKMLEMLASSSVVT